MDDLQYTFGFPQNLSLHDPNHYILTGSFRSLTLFLLAFSPSARTLTKVKSIPGEFGPHQYLAKVDYGNRHDAVFGETREMRIYGTSWAWPPMLLCWGLTSTPSGDWNSWHVGQTPIRAVSSYVNIPPPYKFVYSAGGPVGEVHRIDPSTGGFGDKVEEIFFVEEQDLEKADKTRTALRYGSHAIEFTPDLRYAFIPVLGTNTIEVYDHDSASGKLSHVSSVRSPREEQDLQDGPRHLKVHPNGEVLYCVTEHSNLVDAYRIVPSGKRLEHMSSRSLLPDHLASSASSVHDFRGDTLMLAPSSLPKFLVATTRGSSPKVRGWLSIFALTDQGSFTQDFTVERFETPTSGGKANAVDLLSKQNGEGVWILLTDDDAAVFDEDGPGSGAVRVLEFDGMGTGGVREVAEWPKEKKEGIRGASHAIWLD